uniref:Uncharacterized protein n=1 Tax=Tanacetum cinerariifolium TaxID=118510 RepID=A0A6L2N9Z5_TANCI|nr:hypothetical protein [Tanacetum cinerariifolium]
MALYLLPWPILAPSFAEYDHNPSILLLAWINATCVGRPIGLEDLASWEKGNCTWGGRAEAMGTIPVCVYAQESWGEGTGCLARKLGMGTVWFVIRFRDLSQSVLEESWGEGTGCLAGKLGMGTVWLVSHLVTPESMMIESKCLWPCSTDPQDGGSNRAKDYIEGCADSGALTDEVVRNGSIKKVEKRGNMGKPSKDKNGRDDCYNPKFSEL